MKDNTIEHYESVISHYEKQLYHLRQLIDISKGFASTLDFASLVQALLQICMEHLGVSGAGIFRWEKTRGVMVLEENYLGFDLPSSQSCVVRDAEGFIALFESVDKGVTLDELRLLLPCGHADIPVLEPLGPSLIVPMRYQGYVMGLLILGSRKFVEGKGVFSEDEKLHVSDIATLAALSMNMAVLIDQSSTDMLTQLRQRHFFFNAVENRLQFARMNNIPLAIVMLDIDHFKCFNDTYGHACGDFVLQRVASLILGNIRNEDVAARYGGEEFVLMLFDVDEEVATRITERIRVAVECANIVYDNVSMQVTLSAGLTIFHPKLAPERKVQADVLVDLADQAMYMSKRNGRNRVTYLELDLLDVHQ